MREVFLPTRLFFACLLLIAALHYSFPGTVILHAPWRGRIGFTLLLAGILLNVLAVLSFRENSTVFHPDGLPRTLITNSVYRISRNPMYLGMTLGLLGVTALFGTAAPLPVVVLFVWLITVWFIRHEEPTMEDQFREAYRRYKRKVRRWI
jgi:protein-S-isoprenylcysteine O-methyltransferase Ste14